MRGEYPAWSGLADRFVARPAVRRALEAEGVTIL